MKFTEQQLSEALKAKLTANGKKMSVSDRTLAAMVKKDFKHADDEVELDAYASEILGSYEELEGNYRKDISDRYKQLEEENARQAEQQQQQQKSGAKGEPDGDKGELAQLREALQKLIDRETAREKAQAVAERKASLQAKFKEKGINDDEWVNAQLSLMAIDEKTDVDSTAESVLKLYNQANAHFTPDTTPRGAGRNNPADPSNAFDAYKKAKGLGKKSIV